MQKKADRLLDTLSWEYVKAKYRTALFLPLRELMYEDWWTYTEVWNFTEDCVEEAFERVEEYKPAHRFLHFLIDVIVGPKLNQLYNNKIKEVSGKKTYEHGSDWKKQLSVKGLADRIKPYLEKELTRDVLRRLKANDKTKYEIFYHYTFNDWSFKDIGNEYKMTEHQVRQAYTQIKDKVIPELFYQVRNSSIYLDKDLRFNDGALAGLKSEIKSTN